MESYKEYLKQPVSMTIEEMEELASEMKAEIESDPDAEDFFHDVMEKATKYAAIRAGWLLLSREEKMDQDSQRTMVHNSTIDKFNQLARLLRADGKAAAWRDKLGDERKRIGDFACYLTFIYALNAR